MFFLMLLVTPVSYAIDVQLFRPNFDQSGGFTVQNAELLPKGEYRPSFFINWVKNPIEFGITGTDSRTDELVGWFMTSNFLFALGVRDNLTLGLDLPINFGSEIEPTATTTTKKGFGLGDLHLYGKYRLRQKGEGDGRFVPSIAVIPFFSLPTGKDSDFFGHKNVTGGFRFAFDWQLAQYHKLFLNLGTRLQSSETILNLTVGSEFLWGLGYDYLLLKNQKINLNIELVGSTIFSKFMTEEISSPFELLIGLKKPWWKDRLMSNVGIGRGGNNGYGAPDFRFFAGVTYLFQGPKLFEKKPDSDADGVFDENDQCLAQPEDKDKFEDKDGCPDPDNDHDGFLDADDKCPLEAEIINGVTDEDGCADEGDVKVTIQDSKIVILDKIYFANSKSTILDQSTSILNQVVSVLKANPQVEHVRIEGHTDDRGPAEFNQHLSQTRADKVRQYLIDAGIAADRLESVGYGATKPIESNATRHGREINRRVEFIILDVK